MSGERTRAYLINSNGLSKWLLRPNLCAVLKSDFPLLHWLVRQSRSIASIYEIASTKHKQVEMGLIYFLSLEATIAGTTINPYRFGGQIGYRRNGPNRLYIRERHLDTSRGRWLSKDPLNTHNDVSSLNTVSRFFDANNSELNFYWYTNNDPVNRVDPSGLYCQTAPIDIPIVPCPKIIGTAKSSLCTALKKLGAGGILATGCCTGTKQAQCLIDWCNSRSGNIYCVPDTSNYCGGCGLTYGTPGEQCPDIPTFECVPSVLGLSCGYGCPSAKNHVAVSLLHERIHACGSGDDGLVPDQAAHKAACLCRFLNI